MGKFKSIANVYADKVLKEDMGLGYMVDNGQNTTMTLEPIHDMHKQLHDIITTAKKLLGSKINNDAANQIKQAHQMLCNRV